MHIICCYSSGLHPVAAKALAAYAPTAVLVETSGLYGYGEAIASRWDGTDDLVVIEQDKEITANVIPEFENCSHDWCSFSYNVYPEPYQRKIDIGLGCVKYSAHVQNMVAPSEFLHKDFDWTPCPDCGGKGCWRYLDSRIAFALFHKGFKVHVHGHIEHHHTYSADWAKIRNLEN
jgi:hypothetical protein